MRSRYFIPLIHVFAWLALFLLPLLFMDSERGRDRYIYMGWFLQVLMAGCFYYNYLFLIPKYLLKKRLLLYFFLLLSGFVAVALLNVAFSRTMYNFFEFRHSFSFWRAFSFTIYPTVIACGLSTAIRITTEWFRNERQKKEMEAEKLQSELAFLKSQINPHFLFNTLNNICSLARKKADETEEAIIMLSGIMRYMLQDSRDERVNLGREVEYLKNFITLQRIRLPDTISIDLQVDGDPERITIEPLLLIPFVENAFKHGIGYQLPTSIRISLRVTDNILIFRVENSIFKQPGDTEPGSGIGLKNIRRRLELLYPGRHTLSVEDNGTTYISQLTLQFSP
jgi:LytS/YehU family sensor histidine kinase